MRKHASAMVYLIEELGDARLRCDQLLRYIEQATQLIGESEHKDHFFEVAGDLIRGVPDVAFKLNKALQAVALAADRMDYEEIKQELSPAKVEELERVLKDVRIRHVTRRSDPMTPKEAINKLNLLAAQAKKGSLPLEEALRFAASLDDDDEGQSKEASVSKEASLFAEGLEGLATALANPPEGVEGPSRKRLANILRAMVANTLAISIKAKKSTHLAGKKGHTMCGEIAHKDTLVDSVRDATCYYCKQAWEKNPKAASEADKQSRFEEGKPADPTKEMSKEDAAEWKQNTEEHKDEFKSAAGTEAQPRNIEEAQAALDALLVAARLARQFGGQANYKKMFFHVISCLNDIYNLTNVFDIEGTGPLMRVTKALMPHSSGRPTTNFASSEEKESRFEEGKPADPTKEMSKEDAAKWKQNTEEHKDEFKTARFRGSPDQLFKDMAEVVDVLLDTRVKVRHVTEDLQDLLEDASGLTFTNNYNDKDVRAARDYLYDLDHRIGQTFNSVERLALDLKKKVVKASAAEELALEPTDAGEKMMYSGYLYLIKEAAKKAEIAADNSSWFGVYRHLNTIIQALMGLGDHEGFTASVTALDIFSKNIKRAIMAKSSLKTASAEEWKANFPSDESWKVNADLSDSIGVTLRKAYASGISEGKGTTQEVTSALREAITALTQFSKTGSEAVDSQASPQRWALGAPIGRIPETLWDLSYLVGALHGLSKVASDEDKKSRFEEGKPADPTKEMSKEDAAKWKQNTEEHKDEFKKEALAEATPKDTAEVEIALDQLLMDARKARQYGGQANHKRMFFYTISLLNSVSHLSAVFGIDNMGLVMRIIKTLRPYAGALPTTNFASDEDKQSRFEEGKPADPTKEMSKEDAAKWKQNTEEHKDDFKAAASQADDWKAETAS